MLAGALLTHSKKKGEGSVDRQAGMPTDRRAKGGGGIDQHAPNLRRRRHTEKNGRRTGGREN
jgi:hypothetical protein